MPQLPPLTAALFDLDGTLVNTEPRSRAAWQKLFRIHGVPLASSDLAAFAGRPGLEAIADHVSSFADQSAEALFQEALGYSTGPDMPTAEPVPGALSLLEGLKRDGVLIGVVTSGTRAYAQDELRALNAMQLLDVVITADDVDRGKPDPQGYLMGCAALDVKPVDVVVFEDAPAGVKAAKQAGTWCVALTTTHAQAALSGADMFVPHLDGITWRRNVGGPGSC